MSYCRFIEGDVYLFGSSQGIECCACRLAPLVKTIFTTGDSWLLKRGPCEHCQGEGCERCMMHGSTILSGPAEALAHLEEHQKAGDYVPPRAFEELREELAHA